MAYVVATFLSALLLFLVQPLLAAWMLPVHGGTAGVWSACLLAYQVLLVVGYLYAHLMARIASASTQAVGHGLVVLASLALMPVGTSRPPPAPSSVTPTFDILVLILRAVGGPYVVLAATSPLLQSWMARACPSAIPYRLYAVSNAGSLLALMAYPFLVRPNLPLAVQGQWWSWGYGLLAVVLIRCGWSLRPAPSTIEAGPDGGPAHPPGIEGVESRRGGVAVWTVLALLPSALLMAATHQVCQEIAVVPFLWVAPLALYLVSFIICFERDRWYRRGLAIALFVVLSLASTLSITVSLNIPVALDIAIHLATLFATAYLCHGELARRRPPAGGLTRFYLVVSVGGALGGILIALVMPLLLNDHLDMLLVMGAVWVALLGLMRPGAAIEPSRRRVLRRVVWWSGAAVGIMVAVGAGGALRWDRGGGLRAVRNFYGVVRVDQVAHGAFHLRSMWHGTTLHGQQFTDPDHRTWATTYYGVDSGVGFVLARYRQAHAASSDEGLRLGVIGLGVGTLASYVESHDRIRFYEINPAVIDLAHRDFTFLARVTDQVDVVPGDARIVLAEELDAGRAGDFDLLVVDAFSSGAIPIHLLTREAFQLYDGHLKAGGLLAVHVSNRYLDLAPVVRGHAAPLGMHAERFIAPEQPDNAIEPSVWIILSTDHAFLAGADMQIAATPWASDDRAPVVWTDQRAALWPLLGRPTAWRGMALPLQSGRFVVDEAGMLDAEDHAHVEQQAARLHRSTGGAVAVAVVTIPSLADRGLQGLDFRRFAARMHRRIGMVYHDRDHGLLILASRADQRATFHAGQGWRHAGETLAGILHETLIPELVAGRPSRGLRDAFDQVATLVRAEGVEP